MKLFLILPLFFFVACSSVGLKEDEYDRRMASISLGDSKKDFAKLFPEAKPRGARKYPNGSVEVLEVPVEKYSFWPSGQGVKRNEWSGMEGHPIWFYFYEGKLVQYGKPGDWPKEAEITVNVNSKKMKDE